jgi:fructose-specific phosphotransferase system IIC component
MTALKNVPKFHKNVKAEFIWPMIKTSATVLQMVVILGSVKLREFLERLINY